MRQFLPVILICDKKGCCGFAGVLFKTFKNVYQRQRKILDKETVDEIIFNLRSIRDRLILELQARCGLRIGEVLKLKASDVSGRKLVMQEPKSGKDAEIAFMPEQIASMLTEYIQTKNISPERRLFPLCYTAVRNLVTGLSKKLNVKLSPHDLRRHSATFASRNGVLLEIISKVILRHQDLKTTQVYLGKISDTEAIRTFRVSCASRGLVEISRRCGPCGTALSQVVKPPTLSRVRPD